MVCRFLCRVVDAQPEDKEVQCSVNGYVCLSFLIAQLPLVWILYKLCRAIWVSGEQVHALRCALRPTFVTHNNTHLCL